MKIYSAGKGLMEVPLYNYPLFMIKVTAFSKGTAHVFTEITIQVSYQ